MGEDPGTGGPAITGAREPDQIRAEIEATREELGDTIEALAEKTDIKAQAQHKIEETKASINEKKEELLEKKDELLGKAKQASPETAVNAASQASHKARENPVPLVLIGAFALGFVLGRLTAR
jgi:ElaB/YqjD/DUF883 family membrane-anchored ribosome-binding protein